MYDPMEKEKFYPAAKNDDGRQYNAECEKYIDKKHNEGETKSFKFLRIDNGS